MSRIYYLNVERDCKYLTTNVKVNNFLEILAANIASINQTHGLIECLLCSARENSPFLINYLSLCLMHTTELNLHVLWKFMKRKYRMNEKSFPKFQGFCWETFGLGIERLKDWKIKKNLICPSDFYSKKETENLYHSTRRQELLLARNSNGFSQKFSL